MLLSTIVLVTFIYVNAEEERRASEMTEYLRDGYKALRLADNKLQLLLVKYICYN